MSYQDTEYGRWLVGRVEARGRGVPRMVSRLCDVTVSNELLWPQFLLGTCYLSLRGVASKHNTDLNTEPRYHGAGAGEGGGGGDNDYNINDPRPSCHNTNITVHVLFIHQLV